MFGSDIYYHPACFSKYIKRFENSRRPVQSRTISTRKQLLDSVFEGIHQGLVQGKGYPLSDIRDRCNNLLSTDKVDNRQLKVLLTAKYGNQIRFSRPGSNKKSAMIFLDCVPSEQMADTIREHDDINECAKILRSSLLNVDFGLHDKFCDAHDLESALNGTEVPEDLLRFFGALFNFSHTDFNHPGSQTQSNDHATEKISTSRLPTILTNALESVSWSSNNIGNKSLNFSLCFLKPMMINSVLLGFSFGFEFVIQVMCLPVVELPEQLYHNSNITGLI